MKNKQPELEEMLEGVYRRGWADGRDTAYKGIRARDNRKKAWQSLKEGLEEKLLKWRTDSTLPNKREHEANCEADDRHCTCGAKYYNQAISDIERKLNDG